MDGMLVKAERKDRCPRCGGDLVTVPYKDGKARQWCVQPYARGGCGLFRIIKLESRHVA
jgi:hypothetical protein